MRFRFFLFVVITFISACSSPNDPMALAKEGKWADIGHSDGDRGLPSRSLSDLEKLAQGKPIDFEAYDLGYKAGIDSYCQVENAYSIGLSGMPYNGVCANFPNGLRFNLEWQRGYQAYSNTY